MCIHSLAITTCTILSSKFLFPARPEARRLVEIVGHGHVLAAARRDRESIVRASVEMLLIQSPRPSVHGHGLAVNF
ncbi:hypothetical protein PILCRDRAFT_759972 [Piloderma croceum F 1598]|uniref:Uncharacterized protein n=1 Tax=Piloderma croceum (strain F 1598) TaxID=765440 RepID=A0A0C3ETM5_PILCF|nr:hypothetical protein PILCRDRAFT_759972 [Piloderma croceum F 1598]